MLSWDLVAAKKDWPSIEPTLMAVVKSFKVTG
jgi:hypothetical protein